MRAILAGQSASPLGHHGGAINTPSELQRDEIVRMCIAAGFSASHKLSQAGLWSVAYGVDRDVKLLVSRDCRLDSNVPTKVWCVTVPAKDNLIMVRRVTERDALGATIAVSQPVIVGNTAPEMIKVRRRTTDSGKLNQPGL